MTQCWKCQLEGMLLYPRARGRTNVWMCANCVDLDQGETGRVAFRDGYRRDGDPRSQPAQYSPRSNAPYLDCAWCKAPTQGRYQWRTGLIPACGWGHAGLWMDVQIDEGIDMDYVFKSLGVDQ